MRSQNPVDKQKLPKLIQELNKITVAPPVKCGDVIATFGDANASGKTDLIIAAADFDIT